MDKVYFKTTHIAIRKDIPASFWVVDENGEFVEYNEDIKKAAKKAQAQMESKISKMIWDTFMGGE